MNGVAWALLRGTSKNEPHMFAVAENLMFCREPHYEWVVAVYRLSSDADDSAVHQTKAVERNGGRLVRGPVEFDMSDLGWYPEEQYWVFEVGRLVQRELYKKKE